MIINNPEASIIFDKPSHINIQRHNYNTTSTAMKSVFNQFNLQSTDTLLSVYAHSMRIPSLHVTNQLYVNINGQLINILDFMNSLQLRIAALLPQTDGRNPEDLDGLPVDLDPGDTILPPRNPVPPN